MEKYIRLVLAALRICVLSGEKTQLVVETDLDGEELAKRLDFFLSGTDLIRMDVCPESIQYIFSGEDPLEIVISRDDK